MPDSARLNQNHESLSLRWTQKSNEQTIILGPSKNSTQLLLIVRNAVLGDLSALLNQVQGQVMNTAYGFSTFPLGPNTELRSSMYNPSVNNFYILKQPIWILDFCEKLSTYFPNLIQGHLSRIQSLFTRELGKFKVGWNSKTLQIPKNYERMKFKQSWTSNVTLLMLLKIIALGMRNENFKCL